MNGWCENLAYEKSNQAIFNKFYHEHGYKPSDIERYDYNTKYGRVMQRRDIDLQLIPDEIYISEKSRTYDYGDMCMEIVGNVEKMTTGWLHHSLYRSTSHDGLGPDLIAYKTPEYLYSVHNGEGFQNLIRRIYDYWPVNKAIELFKDCDMSQEGPYKKQGMFDGKNRLFIMNKSIDEKTGDIWWSICICLSWEYIKNNNIVVNKYDL